MINRKTTELLEAGSSLRLLSRRQYFRSRYSRRQVISFRNKPRKNLLTTSKDHCIDDIRQALMCHADPSILTFDWLPNWRSPWPNFAIDHTCVDWNALDDWAAKRSFSVFDQKSLVHPELGECQSVSNTNICLASRLKTCCKTFKDCFPHCQRVD